MFLLPLLDTNKVRSQHLHERTGLYNLELTYKKAGVENEIDIDAFRIVAKVSEASDSSELLSVPIWLSLSKGDTGNGIQSVDLTSNLFGLVKHTELYTRTRPMIDGSTIYFTGRS